MSQSRSHANVYCLNRLYIIDPYHIFRQLPRHPLAESFVVLPAQSSASSTENRNCSIGRMIGPSKTIQGSSDVSSIGRSVARDIAGSDL